MGSRKKDSACRNGDDCIFEKGLLLLKITFGNRGRSYLYGKFKASADSGGGQEAKPQAVFPSPSPV